MRLFSKTLDLWGLAVFCLIGLVLAAPGQVRAARNTQLGDISADASRMVFKENAKNKKEPSCQLTLMHVYTSKFNKKFTQFAFTGSVVAKREVGKPMVLSVIGQNHQLSASGKEIKPFSIPRIELGVDDVSVRRFAEHKNSCKKNSVCVQYKDTKKSELQAWLSDDAKNLHLLFPLLTKQPAVVIDLSKFAATAQSSQKPLSHFKSCVTRLH